MPSVEPALPVPLTTESACSDEQHRASVDSAENRKMLESNIIKKMIRFNNKKSILAQPKNSNSTTNLKMGKAMVKSIIKRLIKRP
ncbi:hypothetical protein Tco_1402596 [Tanacetum coccineum]